MANINDDIAAIRSATYGADVREAIADGIENCYNVTDAFNNADAAITILDAGTPQGTVSITNVGSGSSRHKRFNFGIPRGSTGAKGDKGDTGSPGTNGTDGITPNITIGTVTTGNPGTNASVTRTGTSANPVFNFTIPKGIPGDFAVPELLAPAYSNTGRYKIGDYCTVGNNLYRCIQPVSSDMSFNQNYWSLIASGLVSSGLLDGGSNNSNVNVNTLARNRIYSVNTGSSSDAYGLPHTIFKGSFITIGKIDLAIEQDGSLYCRFNDGTNMSGWRNLSTINGSAPIDWAALIKPWQPNKAYPKGSIVTFNNNTGLCVYHADYDIPASSTFAAHELDWTALYSEQYGPSMDGVLVDMFNITNRKNAQSYASKADLDFLKNYYIPLFDSTKTYRTGSIVKYSGNDNILYIFRKNHTAGPWDPSEVAGVTYAGGVAFPITEWLLDTWNNFAAQYDSTRTYAEGEYVSWNGPYLYRCTTAITIPEAWNGAHWTRAALGGVAKAQSESIGKAFAMIAPPFNANTTYAVGQLVEYNGVVYRMTYPHTGAWNSDHVTNVNGIANSILYDMWRNIGFYYNGGTNYKSGDLRQKGFELYRCNIDLYNNEQWNSEHWTKINIPEAIFNTRGMLAPRFSDSTLYYPGQIVWHGYALYRAVRSHQGEWDGNDFVGIIATNQLFTLANSFTNQYSPARSYKVDEYCVIAGATYRCIEDIDTPEDFDSTHWTRISALDVCDAISNFIAPKFSTAKRYGIGEYCVRNNQLYRFTSPHLEGAWNNNDVEQTNLSDTLSGVSTGVVLKSPNGTRFQLSVANDGTLSASAVE